MLNRKIIVITSAFLRFEVTGYTFGVSYNQDTHATEARIYQHGKTVPEAVFLDVHAVYYDDSTNLVDAVVDLGGDPDE